MSNDTNQAKNVKDDIKGQEREKENEMVKQTPQPYKIIEPSNIEISGSQNNDMNDYENQDLGAHDDILEQNEMNSLPLEFEMNTNQPQEDQNFTS